MRIIRSLLFLALAIGAGLVGGYRLGNGAWPGVPLLQSNEAGFSEPQTSFRPRVILYWKHPDGRPEWSATSAKTADGRDYLPVHDDEEPDFPENAGAKATSVSANSERKILYYRNPMGLPDTSPEPKKDWMGMDYIPVYEGEEADDRSTVKVSLDRVQRAGVRSAIAEQRRLVQPVRAVGKVMVDESRLRIVALRFDGFIEKLYANTTGQSVRKGEPLFRVFSSEVLGALANYRTSMVSAGKKIGREIEGALQRLDNLEVPKSHIRGVGTKGELPASIEWPSPVSGTVIERMVIEGERAEAGRALLKIADLSQLWVTVEVAEQELGLVRVGAAVTISPRAMPGEMIEGRIAFVYPELDGETRTGKARIAVPNPDGRLKPQMFADVVIDVGSSDDPRLVVPADSVIDSGNRQVVILDKGEGRFEPRAVKIGRRGDGYVEILDGIAPGDLVVVTAGFLIDAESNLKAALKSLSPASSPPAASTPASATGRTVGAEDTP